MTTRSLFCCHAMFPFRVCIDYQSIINYRFKEHFAFVGSESDNDDDDFTAEVSGLSLWVVRRKIHSKKRSQ
jgi:hypothetical protein